MVNSSIMEYILRGIVRQPLVPYPALCMYWFCSKYLRNWVRLIDGELPLWVVMWRLLFARTFDVHSLHVMYPTALMEEMARLDTVPARSVGDWLTAMSEAVNHYFRRWHRCPEHPENGPVITAISYVTFGAAELQEFQTFAAFAERSLAGRQCPASLHLDCCGGIYEVLAHYEFYDTEADFLIS